MSQSMMTGFCKNEDCPSSHELLGYQTGDLERSRAVEIRKHMTRCEFCSAEVEFYSHYPQEDSSKEQGAGEITEIPAPLFQLAEALLKNRHQDPYSLNSLFDESVAEKG